MPDSPEGIQGPLTIEGKVLSSRIRNLDYDLARSDWFGDYMDPATFLNMFTTDSDQNRTGWSSPRYDRLIAAAAAERDDARRFARNHQVGSYVGLIPCQDSSGGVDRLGHITRQGPSRVRKVLCQAVWSAIRVVPQERQAYDRLVQRNPKHKKIAVVARMRALGVRLWHAGLEAQQGMRAAPLPA